MRNKFLRVLLIVLALAFATACGDGSGSGGGADFWLAWSPIEVSNSSDTVVTITAAKGYSLVGAPIPNGIVCKYTLIFTNPLEIEVLGTQMNVGEECIFTLTYSKGGNNISETVEIPIVP